MIRASLPHRFWAIGWAALLLLSIGLLSACGSTLAPVAEATVQPTQGAATAVPSAGTTAPALVASPSPVPSPSPTYAPTSTPTPTVPPTPTPTPTLTPAASLLAFETDRDGNSEIYVLDTVTGKALNLTRHPAEDRAPAWRPDGLALAFESRRDGNWEIYVLDLVDGSLARLTHNLAYDGAPTWSPDGSEIAFESYRDGNLEIYAVAVAGEGKEPGLRRITDDGSGAYGPAWSPDGSQIAFTSWRDGNKEIYVASATGAEARNVTQHPADDEQPAWSPDGQSLAFVSWRDVDAVTGNRNAEIYRLGLGDGQMERLTDNPWPDVQPAWDREGLLVWSAYDPGEPFETYDPYRPGEFHLYRASAGAPEALPRSPQGQDRRPAPAPTRAISLVTLDPLLPEPLVPPTPDPALAPGRPAEIVEVPSVLASFADQPVRVNELVAPSLVAWQQDVLQASGWDFLRQTLGSWRNIDQVRKKALYAYDYGYLSWHKTGRALDLALEFKVDGVDQMVLAREDLGSNVFWRIYLRTARQDGSQGEPLKENRWRHWWHIVPAEEPEAYAAGGKRLPIPGGYYVDVTALAKRHGWERIACYAIEGDYHWLTDSNGTEYWHYQRTDGLIWWEAMSQIYEPEVLEEHVGWAASMEHAQSEEMARSKGVPSPAR